MSGTFNSSTSNIINLYVIDCPVHVLKGRGIELDIFYTRRRKSGARRISSPDLWVSGPNWGAEIRVKHKLVERKVAINIAPASEVCVGQSPSAGIRRTIRNISWNAIPGEEPRLDVLICSFSCINSTTVRVETQAIAVWCVRIRTAAHTPIGAVGGV